MFPGAAFIKATNCKQAKCPSTVECINKVWYSQTMNYYTAARMDELLLLATTWMILKNMILNKTKDARPKSTYCMVSLM